ncbi:MAG TPA: AAA family ATPase [Kofleriaceae bacterium]|nr:AAA family ATPase [Kofleriaceae bacterium]
MVLRGGRGDPASSELPPGSVLVPGAEVGGRYRIRSLLGAGGMARVWLADDLEQRMQVAFKEMLVPSAGTAAELEESVLLFRREYFAMKKLQHPGTVRVYDCGVMETGNRYITMEVVGGRDLSELAEHPLPSAEVRRILGQLAQILGFVHSRLFVHCDIKAENIRITDAGDVKLMDFGIMHPIGTRALHKVWGTPAYMAPEWRAHGIIDGRSDLYSLGVLGFLLLTRMLPFGTEEQTRPVRAQLMRPALELSVLAEVDPALSAIILRLLERDPPDRFQSAAELAVALHEAGNEASNEVLAEEPLAARASYLQLPVVVGRERETAELAARLDAARRGEARALLIGAPAGVGKSRLLQELELDARNVDVPFALGQCRAEGLSARAPVEQALRALVPVTPAAILEPLRPVLGRLLPGLAGGAPRAFRDASEEKIAVFEALSRWLRELAAHAPFVLCLEDLHWADSATLEAMNVIVRALHRTGGLVVATFRSDELSRLGLGFQTVDEGFADHLELAPLSEQGLAHLVELALQGFGGGELLARRLYETTRGNVFFATECLRALIEEGALTRRLGTWTADPGLAERPLPRSIHEVVLARLSTLPEPQIAFFRRLAPAGRVLDIPLIQAIADASPHEMFQILDEGIERQFLQYVEGRYIFTHATVHEAIYDSTPEPLRRRYHGRIAEHMVHAAGDRAEAARAIGYHFARSDEPVRAIDPLLRAAARALDNKALLEAFGLLEQAAELLEGNPGVPDRDRRLIEAWGTLIEVGYHSSTPACIRYAQKLFAHWDRTVDLARGGAELRRELADACAAPPGERAARLGELFRERPLAEVRTPRDAFLKRAEYRILESIALAITGRTAEFAAGLERTAEEHPPASPYRAAPHVAIGGLTSHTGHFRGAVDAMRGHIGALRAFRGEVASCPRRLEWALGMGGYFMNMNLALMGLPLDDGTTADGFEIAERLGMTDLRIYHLFSQIVRASFIGDGSAYAAPFAEMNELIRKLGHPRLPERNLAIYTPPYYLERGELELARAVIERGERFRKLLPGDRWLALYVDVYRACLLVALFTGGAAEGAATPEDATEDAAIPEDSSAAATEDATAEATDAALSAALASSRAADFRMETLVLVHRSRFEHARGNAAAARAAAETALARAIDPLRANPFDEILARRALADTAGAAEAAFALAELSLAASIAARTGNVLQHGIVQLALADRAAAGADSARSEAHLAAAESSFAAACADRWLRRAGDRRRTS